MQKKHATGASEYRQRHPRLASLKAAAEAQHSNLVDSCIRLASSCSRLRPHRLRLRLCLRVLALVASRAIVSSSGPSTTANYPASSGRTRSVSTRHCSQERRPKQCDGPLFMPRYPSPARSWPRAVFISGMGSCTRRWDTTRPRSRFSAGCGPGKRRSRAKY